MKHQTYSNVFKVIVSLITVIVLFYALDSITVDYKLQLHNNHIKTSTDPIENINEDCQDYALFIYAKKVRPVKNFCNKTAHNANILLSHINRWTVDKASHPAPQTAKTLCNKFCKYRI